MNKVYKLNIWITGKEYFFNKKLNKTQLIKFLKQLGLNPEEDLHCLDWSTHKIRKVE